MSQNKPLKSQYDQSQRIRSITSDESTNLEPKHLLYLKCNRRTLDIETALLVLRIYTYDELVCNLPYSHISKNFRFLSRDLSGKDKYQLQRFCETHSASRSPQISRIWYSRSMHCLATEDDPAQNFITRITGNLSLQRLFFIHATCLCSQKETGFHWKCRSLREAYICLAMVTKCCMFNLNDDNLSFLYHRQHRRSRARASY